jgi:hypothetical protein
MNEQITVEAVEAAWLADDKRVVAPWRSRLEQDAAQLVAGVEASICDRPAYSVQSEGLKLARHIAHLGRVENDERLLDAAARIADELFVRYFNPAGTFVEYDKAWLQPHELWRSIPWGTGFRSNAQLDLFDLVGDRLAQEARQMQLDAFVRIGRWIHRNPICGSFVFNCVADLGRALWRIGALVGEPSFCANAIAFVRERIERDLDADGFCHGENGGVSGTYQIVGADFLADLAHDCGDSTLLEAVARMSRANVAWASPTLVFPGNFGTRSGDHRPVAARALLVGAANGDRASASLVHRFGRHAWSRDLSLWRAALAVVPQDAPQQAVRTFAGLDATVVRCGPWTAWLSNYARSLWGRGFIDLFHAGLGDFVFATLHALPSKVEKTKLRLGDTSDWAGFPRVRVVAENGDAFDSHQSVDVPPSITQATDALHVEWTEVLRDRAGNAGPRLHVRLTLGNADLMIDARLSDATGFTSATFDFHVLRRPASFAGIWWGDDLDAINNGRLPRHGGWHVERQFLTREVKRWAVQIDNALLAIDFIGAPAEASVTASVLESATVHTGNIGGARLRVSVPDPDDASLSVTCRLITPSAA